MRDFRFKIKHYITIFPGFAQFTTECVYYRRLTLLGVVLKAGMGAEIRMRRLLGVPVPAFVQPKPYDEGIFISAQQTLLL